MNLIVGLGNPGDEYTNTPHNAGFLALDLFAKNNGLEWQPKFSSYFTEYRWRFKGELKAQAILVKPQLFMNRSGLAVREFVRLYKLKPRDIWVVHDELDLPIGRVKITFDRSAAGHKGVESIIATLGTQQFYRFRIGVMPPQKPKQPDTYLTNIPVAKAQWPDFEASLENAQATILKGLKEGIVKAQTAANAWA